MSVPAAFINGSEIFPGLFCIVATSNINACTIACQNYCANEPAGVAAIILHNSVSAMRFVMSLMCV